MLCYVMWNLFTVSSLQFPNDSTIASLEANHWAPPPPPPFQNLWIRPLMMVAYLYDSEMLQVRREMRNVILIKECWHRKKIVIVFILIPVLLVLSIRRIWFITNVISWDINPIKFTTRNVRCLVAFIKKALT